MIELLKNAGYIVENMGLEYGSDFEGCFRWMNLLNDTFQDHDVSYSEDDAWKLAEQNFAQLNVA
jgi:hypothetical protein